jgi:hypothetical protein
MTQRTELPDKPIHSASVGKRILLGADIAFIVVILILLGVGVPGLSTVLGLNGRERTAPTDSH